VIELILGGVCLWLIFGCGTLMTSTSGTDAQTAKEQEAWAKKRYELTDEQYRSQAWFDGDFKNRGVSRSEGSLRDRTVHYVWWWFIAAAVIVFGFGWRL